MKTPAREKIAEELKTDIFSETSPGFQASLLIRCGLPSENLMMMIDARDEHDFQGLPG